MQLPANDSLVLVSIIQKEKSLDVDQSNDNSAEMTVATEVVTTDHEQNLESASPSSYSPVMTDATPLGLPTSTDGSPLEVSTCIDISVKANVIPDLTKEPEKCLF